MYLLGKHIFKKETEKERLIIHIYDDSFSDILIIDIMLAYYIKCT